MVRKDPGFKEMMTFISEYGSFSAGAYNMHIPSKPTSGYIHNRNAYKHSTNRYIQEYP